MISKKFQKAVCSIGDKSFISQGLVSRTYPVDTMLTVKVPSMRYMALERGNQEGYESPERDDHTGYLQNAVIFGIWGDICNGNDHRQFGKAYANHVEKLGSILGLNT